MCLFHKKPAVPKYKSNDNYHDCKLRNPIEDINPVRKGTGQTRMVIMGIIATKRVIVTVRNSVRK